MEGPPPALWITLICIHPNFHRRLRPEASPMNHTRIAAEAIRFRISTIRRPLVSSETIDVDAMAAAALTAASPEVDSALRVIATAWQRAGFDPEEMIEPWRGEQAEYFRGRPELIDLIDVIVRGASRSNAAA